MTVLLVLFAPALPAVSFDCSKAQSFVEKTVCATPKLRELDELLYDRYMAVIESTDFTDEMAAFYRRLFDRLHNCRDEYCIRRVYEGGLSELGHLNADDEVVDEESAELSATTGIMEEIDLSAELKKSSEEEDPEVYALKTDCASSNYRACEQVSVFYRYGDKVEKNLIAAAVWGEIACALGSPNACGVIGAGYFYGAPMFGMRRDYVLAFRYLKKACDELNDERACHLLGYAYTDAHGVRKNSRKGMLYHTKGCGATNDKSCSFIKIAKACAGNDPAACFLYQQAVNHLKDSFRYLQEQSPAPSPAPKGDADEP